MTEVLHERYGQRLRQCGLCKADKSFERSLNLTTAKIKLHTVATEILTLSIVSGCTKTFESLGVRISVCVQAEWNKCRISFEGVLRLWIETARYAFQISGFVTDAEIYSSFKLFWSVVDPGIASVIKRVISRN
jgi:hypothetical protein